MKKSATSLCFILFFGALNSCAFNDKKSETVEATEAIKAIEAIEVKEQNYVGLEIQEARELAKANQVRFRVIERDGKPLAATMDYVPGRINARVKDDKVIGFSVEGQ